MTLSKLKFLLAIFALVICFVACTEDETSDLVVGQDFTDTNIRVLEIDTFEVKMSTMKFDRILSGNSSRMLLGQYSDTDFGEVKTSSYFRLASNNFSVEDNAVLDRVALVLNYDGYVYNDTTNLQNINIHKLADEYEPQGNDDDFFNDTVIPINPTPLATATFMPWVGRDSLYVELPIATDTDFARDLFNKIQAGDIESNEALVQELEGLHIRPSDTDNGAVVGFLPNSSLKFYYTYPDDDSGEFGGENEAVLELTIDNFYNNISSDVSGLPIEVLDDQEINLLSTDSNNQTYMQSGVGYATRIEFPSIRRLFEINGTGTVLNATLRMKPNRDSYSDLKPIDEILGLYIVDQNNDVTQQVFNNIDFVFARLVNQNPEFGEIIYNIPVLEFVESKLNEQPITENALILLPFENESRVNSVLYNDAFNEDFEAVLTVTYAIYED